MQLTNQSATKLTNPSTQHDYILLDASSSMTTKWADCLAAIDAFVIGASTAGVNSDTTVHIFYSQAPDYIHSTGPISAWVPLRSSAPVPCGHTPLYDAINAMGLRLRSLNPSRASILIVTDGDDNMSVTSLTQARLILDWMRAKGWQITFIGADFANMAQASLLGSCPESSIGVQRKLLAQAGAALATKRANYAHFGTPMHFTPGEQQQFGGYLAAPSQGA